MNLTIGNIWGNAPPGPVRSAAQDILKYRRKGYQFTNAFQERRWDGWDRLVSKTGHYPAGLTDELLEGLRERGYEDVTVEDTRQKPAPHPTISRAKLLVPLHAAQERGLEAAERAGRGVVQASTGIGKTRQISALTARLGVPILITVHRKTLLKQIVEALQEELDIPVLIGTIGAGIYDPRPVTVAMLQTLARRLKTQPEETTDMLSRFQGVICDEVHHLGSARTFEEVARTLTNAYYRIGLSATAHRSDDETRLRVTGWTGPIVDDTTTTEGIALKRIVPADVFMISPGPPYPDGLPWQEAYKSGVVQHDSRNHIITEAAARLPGLSMILVERIEHGERLMLRLFDRGDVRACFLDGSDSDSHREKMLAKAREGELDVLIGTEILGEGVNVPAVRNLIVARAGRAPHRTIQAVGRGTRAHEGKDRVIVLDFLDEDWKYKRDKDTGQRKRVKGPLTTQGEERRKTYASEEAYSVTDISFEEMMQWLT